MHAFSFVAMPLLLPPKTHRWNLRQIKYLGNPTPPLELIVNSRGCLIKGGDYVYLDLLKAIWQIHRRYGMQAAEEW